MYATVLTLVALVVFLLALLAWTHRCGARTARRLERQQASETALLHAARLLMAASREGSDAVLSEMDRTLRALEPAIDAVLVFVPAGEDLLCVHAGGRRTGEFAGARLRRDRSRVLPALAAAAGHRILLCGDARPVLPTDRSALAVPMACERDGCAVVYAASAASQPFGNVEALVRTIELAAQPYGLAVDREADRADATFDGLTGLLTPRAFRIRLEREIARARLTGNGTLSLWFVDTDNFKRVNDTFGHATGDVVLQRMAALLRAHTVPGVDLTARNGGDEFCAIVCGAQKTVAIERAQGFCRAVRECDFGVDAKVSASVGVATYPYDAGTASALLETADAAMYHSKRAGRDCVSFASNPDAFDVYR
ncbi:MAG: GGDEF domain-containing protein [Vulcanimicrobiaceae bacterium]